MWTLSVSSLCYSVFNICVLRIIAKRKCVRMLIEHQFVIWERLKGHFSLFCVKKDFKSGAAGRVCEMSKCT